MIYNDLADTQSAMSDVIQSSISISSDCVSISNQFENNTLVMGPHTYYVDGYQLIGNPLSLVMGLVEPALASVRSHQAMYDANALAPLGQFPSMLAAATGTVGSPGIINDLASIAVVQGAVPPSALPTGAQRQAVATALADIVNQIAGLHGALVQIQVGIANYESTLAADNQMLQNGIQAITTTTGAPEWANKVVENFAQDGPDRMIFLSFGNTYRDFYNQVANEINQFVQQINGIVDSQNNSVPNLSHLQNVFAGLLSDYSSVTQEANQAADADFGSIIQQIDVSVLQDYWQNASAFAAAHSFGVPNWNTAVG